MCRSEHNPGDVVMSTQAILLSLLLCTTSRQHSRARTNCHAMLKVSVGHELRKDGVKTVYLCIKSSSLTGVVHDG